ncbi:L-serine ammonia-lyase [Pseudohoeflea coraliihabitans]|uniref:L-serine dehydratase n=1 Tax=Pseudohoeflea coraliihabitans TaxID=2860393 RepID=A0ABS6WSW8_9HYPH|nr:L-serine ammonia-lyase [Pseudohoeflea sp. DP4N28-3]
MFLSVFDIFKIGVGPSSSHTMGPMSAAARFLDEIAGPDWPRPHGAVVRALKVSLHGSLAFTGVGHATDRAVILGLCGARPDTVDPDSMETLVESVRRDRAVSPEGHPTYQFNPATDLVFDRKQPLPGHANGMVFTAYDRDETLLLRRVYYSVGGGFILSDIELEAEKKRRAAKQDAAGAGAAGPGAGPRVPYPFANGREMLEMAGSSGLSIAEMKRANEEVHMSGADLDAGLDRLWQAMDGCVERGLRGEGHLPGGLKVRRRAQALHEKLQDDWKSNRVNPLQANDWLSLFAMAVNEENAAGGRVVTAPTNGASGVVPAVLRYLVRFHEDLDDQAIRNFLLTAAAIGGILKTNASISGAEVGCQGEVGSASAMAAAGMAAVLGGTPHQIENAAEIALEHHLGMTCDPVAGLVQVPCIERNALGAVKAVTAASLAIRGDGTHFVSLDACIETMRQTGRDMSDSYKETSKGGLAVNVVEC